jgi:hypothetical protein
MHCLLKWDLAFYSKDIYYLFVCSGIGVFRGNLHISVGRSVSPAHLSLHYSVYIWVASPWRWAKNHLEYQVLNHLRKQWLCFGFQVAFVKLIGTVAAKYLLQRKLKEQKGRNFTLVWQCLWIEKAHPKECAEKKAAGIRHQERRHPDGLLGLKEFYRNLLLPSVGMEYTVGVFRWNLSWLLTSELL